jgi:hypothetical protein
MIKEYLTKTVVTALLGASLLGGCLPDPPEYQTIEGRVKT